MGKRVILWKINQRCGGWPFQFCSNFVPYTFYRAHANYYLSFQRYWLLKKGGVATKKKHFFFGVEIGVCKKKKNQLKTKLTKKKHGVVTEISWYVLIMACFDHSLAHSNLYTAFKFKKSQSVCLRGKSCPVSNPPHFKLLVKWLKDHSLESENSSMSMLH